MRRPIVAGNWKMNTNSGEARELAGAVVRGAEGIQGVDVVLCPPFTALATVSDVVRDTPVALGAQNAHWQPDGAFTGEVSLRMLQDLGCRYVIVGHSERRTMFGETDATVNRRARAILDAGLTPIVCVGETLEQREAGRTEEVLARQIDTGLSELDDDLGRLVIAYEPVWAIGTGRTASPDQAQQAHAFIRARLADRAGPETAATIRIQYGGSVKPSNARELFGRDDVDGGLIGGASLDAPSFTDIVVAAC